MLQPKLLSVLGAFSMALFFGAGPSKADVITFGNQAAPTGCTHSGADAGLVCPAGPLMFTVGSTTFTANASTGVLTFKPGPSGSPANDFGQSGLGANGAAAPAGCTDPPNCEIVVGDSVTITSNGSLEDAVIGSVQDGESFTLTSSTFNSGTVTGGTSSCNTSAGAETCSLTFPDTGSFTVTTVSGDVLVTEASVAQGVGVPEPASLLLLGTGLLGLGWLGRRRQRAN